MYKVDQQYFVYFIRLLVYLYFPIVWVCGTFESLYVVLDAHI